MPRLSRWSGLACRWLAASVLSAGVATSAEPEARRAPNVLVVLGDDMGFSDLGCQGSEIRTPNLDALAAGGLQFTQFYNTARCCPTRASLLTGLYPHQARVGHMLDDKGPEFPGYRGDLNLQTPTIAEVLRPAGYRTYMVGKWHVAGRVGPDGPKHNWPLQRGFDRYYGMIDGAGNYFDPFSLTRDNTRISPFADPEYAPETYYFTDALTDNAVRFLRDHDRNHAQQPFFMYLAYTAAHWPMHALPEDIARYKGKYDAGYEPIRKARFEKAAALGLVDAARGLAPIDHDWSRVANPAREAACMEVYAAMVDRMDQGIGKVVAELKRTGRFENTLILFLQDNGACAEDQGRKAAKDRVDGPRPDKPTLPTIPPEALAKALIPRQTRDGYPVRQGPNVVPGPADTYVAYGRGWANVGNTPFREYKHWVHEGGISTPLIAHWPAGITARGALRRQPGHLIDVMATCIDVSGAPFPAKHNGAPTVAPEGKSLVPAFADRPIDRDALFWEHEGNRAVREGDWKLVAKGPGGPWELYDLATDRVESHDRAADHPERVARLRARWEAWALRAHALPWPWKPAYPAPPEPQPGPAAANPNPNPNPNPTERPPNIVLILCDDLGYADIEPFGAPKTKTPHLTRFAAEGRKLTDFHVAADVCTPSRAALLTGCYPKRINLHQSEKGGWVLTPGDQRGLSASEVTLAELLRSRGYATACVGKWHLGDQPEFLPTRHGFDVYFGIPYSNDMGQTTDKGRDRPGRPPTPLLRGERVVEEEPDQSRLTRRYTEEAVRFIEESRDRPFFLYLAHAMPHWPQYSSEAFAGRSANGRYGDAVEEIDWSTGAILAALKRNGLDERTLVLFTSDNGGPIKQGANNAPLRGAKGTTWEGGMRVPCLVRWPGTIAAGTVRSEFASTMDLLPTFARLAGAAIPTDRVIDGRDIWPVLAGEPGAAPPHEPFFHYHLGQLRAVRSGPWKLIVPHVAHPNQSKPTETVAVALQLYNLESDLSETHDVAADHPDVVGRLTALADRCRADLGDDSLHLAGAHCRPAGRVANSRPLTHP